MSKLDRSKPFGEVFGTHPARYEQDGRFFNAAEEEIEVKAIEVADVQAEKTSARRVKLVAVTKQAAAAKPAGKKQTAKAAAPVTETSPADPVDGQLAAQLGDSDASFE